jgi:hypothetical protein
MILPNIVSGDPTSTPKAGCPALPLLRQRRHRRRPAVRRQRLHQNEATNIWCSSQPAGAPPYRNDGHQTPPLCRRCAQPLCDGRAPARAVRDTMRRCSQPLRARRRRWPRDCESVCCLNASLRVCSPPRAQTSTRRPRSSASCRCPRSYSRRSWNRMAGARVPPAAPPPRRPASRNSKASVIFSDR